MSLYYHQVCQVSKELVQIEYLDYPLSHKAHELLHTTYFARGKNDFKVNGAFNINKNNEM